MDGILSEIIPVSSAIMPQLLVFSVRLYGTVTHMLRLRYMVCRDPKGIYELCFHQNTWDLAQSHVHWNQRHGITDTTRHRDFNLTNFNGTTR